MPSGGKRIGAGKKPGKHGTKVPFTVVLTPDVMTFLKEVYGSGASAHLDETIRKQAKFKTWQENRSK